MGGLADVCPPPLHPFTANPGEPKRTLTPKTSENTAVNTLRQTIKQRLLAATIGLVGKMPDGLGPILHQAAHFVEQSAHLLGITAFL